MITKAAERVCCSYRVRLTGSDGDDAVRDREGRGGAVRESEGHGLVGHGQDGQERGRRHVEDRVGDRRDEQRGWGGGGVADAAGRN